MKIISPLYRLRAFALASQAAYSFGFGMQKNGLSEKRPNQIASQLGCQRIHK